MAKLFVTAEWNEGSIRGEVEKTESALYHFIGELLPNLVIPNTLRVYTDIGRVEFTIKQRGDYIKDGEVYPSMYVVENLNTIDLPSDTYEDAYLTCIHPESNNYKFYWLRPSITGIQATYGRIGSVHGEMFGERSLLNPYPTRMYWIRYFEKLSKGYIDQTDIYLKSEELKKDTEEGEEEIAEDKDTPAYILYEQLMSYASHVVEETFVNKHVTIAQAKEARRLFEILSEKTSVAGFNSVILDLMKVAPRRCSDVMMFLARSERDFSDIVNREENILLSMEAVALKKPSKKLRGFAKDEFEIYIATDKQKEQVLSKLNDSLKGNVLNVYRVIPKAQQERFNAYLKKNDIHEVKQLWHGSRNCNWLSIVENGLQLNPNAQITGKMFGKGIYFAPNAYKSWGYTSHYGSRWAGGSDSRVFMGLYATAYGKPWNLDSAYTTLEESDVKSQGYDCVHAHAGNALMQDEIVFYNEDAIVLNYIVEFAA